MAVPPRLDGLPPELLGRILWCLTASDILGLKLVCLAAYPPCGSADRIPVKVNRSFRDVIANEPHLQYKCELLAAGLLENPGAHGTFFDRRSSLHAYHSRFDGLKPTGKSSLPLGATGFCWAHESSGDVHALHATSTDTLHFCRPPSASGSRPMKAWSLLLSFEPESFLIHPPLDLVVIADNA